MNVVLKRALKDVNLRTVDVAVRLGVDPKTVERWIAGRRPHPRFRTALVALTGVAEERLWPPSGEPARIVRRGSSPHEVKAAYPHRGLVADTVWHDLFASAERQIDVLVYSGLFLAEDSNVQRLWTAKARAGVKIRLLLGDPDSPQVAQRGADERIGQDMAARVRNALVLLEPLTAVPGVEVRTHRTVLYNSIFRADDEMLVNPHIYGSPAFAAPVLHLRATDHASMFPTYADSFERVWTTARPFAR